MYQQGLRLEAVRKPCKAYFVSQARIVVKYILEAGLSRSTRANSVQRVLQVSLDNMVPAGADCQGKRAQERRIDAEKRLGVAVQIKPSWSSAVSW